MEYFPAFMNLKGRGATVIGGGAVAARKIAMLRRAGAPVSVIAPRLHASLARDEDAGRIEHRARAFEPEHLDGSVIIIAATDNRDLNRQVARHARLRAIPVNVVDDPELSSFIMPAVIDRSPVMVAVSTGGASPVLARWTRARIEAALPTALGRLGALAGRYRDAVRNRLPEERRRRRFWEELFEGPVMELALSGRENEAEAALRSALDVPDQPRTGEVFLVGAGPGDPELLTLKALRVLQSADVIVHDRPVSDVLDLARRDAERIHVGKQAQDEIIRLLVAEARAGRRVVRLTGGDPFIFGHGGEEMAAVQEAGIACHVVPGIAAAVGRAAQAIHGEENAA